MAALQEDVRPTLEMLRNAGIKVWQDGMVQCMRHTDVMNPDV